MTSLTISQIDVVNCQFNSEGIIVIGIVWSILSNILELGREH